MNVSNHFADYLANNREAHLNELNELLRIPSISALSEHKKDIEHVHAYSQSRQAQPLAPQASE